MNVNPEMIMIVPKPRQIRRLARAVVTVLLLTVLGTATLFLVLGTVYAPIDSRAKVPTQRRIRSLENDLQPAQDPPNEGVVNVVSNRLYDLVMTAEA